MEELTTRQKAAKKAWNTRRRSEIEKMRNQHRVLDNLSYSKEEFGRSSIKVGSYKISSPLIKPSKLTSKERGGIGKELSQGWALNFAVGCTHGCLFCYVDSIHKRYGKERYGPIINEDWGHYFLIPSNIVEAIAKTNWSRWNGQEVLLSATHDPYLPKLSAITRRILKEALPEGVKFCIQTRSPLVMNDFDLLSEYRHQIRLQVSIATMNEKFARKIELGVALPRTRLDIIRKAKQEGLEVGVIIAPIFPSLKDRPDVREDLRAIMKELAEIKPDHIYGESLHARGENISNLKKALGEDIGDLSKSDKETGVIFENCLKETSLNGTWWPEHRHQ
jgi:DNA repair photolyase